MEEFVFFESVLINFVATVMGGMLGMHLRDRVWKAKGDHQYMNTMECGGKLYLVKKIPFENPQSSPSNGESYS